MQFPEIILMLHHFPKVGKVNMKQSIWAGGRGVALFFYVTQAAYGCTFSLLSKGQSVQGMDLTIHLHLVLRGLRIMFHSTSSYCNRFDQSIAKQRLSKHFPTCNNIWETVFSMWSAPNNSRKTGLCNPFVGNGSVNTFRRIRPFYATRWRHQQYKPCFPWGLCRVLMREVNTETNN
jgi:hypothetical protein